MEIDRPGEQENGVFNGDVNKSVIVSDYSSDYDEEYDTHSEHDLHEQSPQQRTVINRGFMKGCYVTQEVENDLDYQQVVAKRLEATFEDIREPENYEYEFLKRDYPGVPLKHFLDNYIRYGKIQHDEECPTPNHDSFFNLFMSERNNNRIEWYKPEVAAQFPKTWNKWHDEFDLEKLRKMPMKTEFIMDLINFVSDPAPMQPKSTKNELTFSTYLVSPNKVIITQQVQGRDFIFADRFQTEYMFDLTQTVDPRIDLETDPQRRLQMFTTHLVVKGRFKIIKSLSLLKSKFIAEGSKRIQAVYKEPMDGLDVIL